MAANRTHYRVVPAGSKWELRREQATLSAYHRKEDAVHAGQQEAKAHQPSILTIHLADGRIEKEYTYGDDPYPPKG